MLAIDDFNIEQAINLWAELGDILWVRRSGKLCIWSASRQFSQRIKAS